MSSTKVSTDFTQRELVRSRDFPELELELVEVEAFVLINAAWVVFSFLQPARTRAGGRLGVLSFIRGDDLNDMLVRHRGAKPDSDHKVGLAADFVPLDMTAEAFFELAMTGELEAAGCSWDKLNLYEDPGTFHVAHRPVGAGPPRMRVYRGWQRIV
ncbi:MAG: hypothetical protein GY898_23030 [Proteobacteria bacterium]|nr:hypothetical protein [Pseudomonadota bacterium]